MKYEFSAQVCYGRSVESMMNLSRAMLEVGRVKGRPTIDAKWDKESWRGVEPMSLRHHMGEPPEHSPRTLVKVAYDEAAIYVIFRVEDRYVRATTQRHQGAVCKDSCVEFFFTTGTDVSTGYFNLEMNCGGTMLFHFQEKPRGGVEITEDDYGLITIATTLPRIVDPEIEQPTTWVVEYRIPIEILDKYCKLSKPAQGVKWRGNFYKCGDDTSHPHWLTWSAVDHETPNFHLPDFLGDIEFT